MRYWGEIEVVRAFSTGLDEQPTAPPVDMYETDTLFVVECDLPGVEGDLLAVKLSGANVFIECGTRKKSPRGEPLQYHCVERSPEGFVREIVLPGPVDAGSARARYESGVLTVTLPKLQERRGRAITIPIDIA